MKIIYFAPSLDPYDGYARYSYDVISRIASAYEVSVICHKKSNRIPGIKEYDILRPPNYYFANPLCIVADILKVRRILKKELRGNDTVLHFTAEGYALFIPLFFGLKFKGIMTTHGTYSVLPLTNWKTRWLYIKIYQRLDKIISVSNFTKKHLLNYAGNFILDNKIEVVLNGVDFIDRVLPDRSGHNKCTIISIGEIKQRKGAHNLVRVAKILKKRGGMEFKVLFIGDFNKDSEYCRKLLEFIEKNDLKEEVSFIGRVTQDEKDAYYKEADIFALLSTNENFHYEGYPLVFHEAASWGLPTIGSFNCGAEDAIKDGETGVLVNPYDHEGVAKKIYQIWKGDIKINPRDCQEWAKANSWDNKNLTQMYKF